MIFPGGTFSKGLKLELGSAVTYGMKVGIKELKVPGLPNLTFTYHHTGYQLVTDGRTDGAAYT